MLSVKCTVALLSDQNRKVEVKISKENNQLLWRVNKSSGGSLKLSANDGTWELFGNMIILSYETMGAERKKMIPGYTKLPTLVMPVEKITFFEDIVNNGQTIETKENTLFNDNPAEKNVSCRLERMN